MDLDREDRADGAPDVTTTLRTIRAHDQRGIYLLLDFHPYLGYATTQRMLREILERRGSQEHTIVLVGAKIELPPDLEHAGGALFAAAAGRERAAEAGAGRGRAVPARAWRPARGGGQGRD